uniref:Uncharacterized protein n=1 Tax=Triticum urartu TaxID=4572 RepID=A0A8R7QRM9_TRIUA
MHARMHVSISKLEALHEPEGVKNAPCLSRSSRRGPVLSSSFFLSFSLFSSSSSPLLISSMV